MNGKEITAELLDDGKFIQYNGETYSLNPVEVPEEDMLRIYSEEAAKSLKEQLEGDELKMAENVLTEAMLPFDSISGKPNRVIFFIAFSICAYVMGAYVDSVKEFTRDKLNG